MKWGGLVYNSFVNAPNDWPIVLPACLKRILSNYFAKTGTDEIAAKAGGVVNLCLNEDRRIRLPLPFSEMVARYEAGSSPFFVQDYTAEILCHAADYPTIRDPFDRVIVATAATLGYPLITHDGFLQDAAFVPTVW